MGFIVSNVAEAVVALDKIPQINRQHCRNIVENKFSVEKMVDNYINVYKKSLNSISQN